MAAGDATWNPKKNVAYRVTFPILDADGDLVTGATGLDSEVSKDSGTFADCTNEATEIATSSGVYYLDLTATEMNADTVAVIVKTSSSGAKTTVLVMYPLETSDMPVDVLSWNSVAATGMPMPTYTQPSGFLAATFPGGTIASTTNITAGTIATVTNAVTVGTNNDKTGYSLVTAPPTAAAIADAVWDETIGDHLAAGSTGAALNAAGSAGDPWTTTLPGSYTGSQAGKILADILTDTGTTLQAELDGIQADTEDIQSRLPAALVSGRMDASVGAMAANVLTASALATDAVTEVAGGVWNALTASYVVSGSFGERILRSTDTDSEVVVTATGHVAANIHQLQAAVINNTHFAAGALDDNALAASAATEIATATLGATVEGSETLVQAVRLVRAALVGKLSGAATTTVTIRDAADSKARITTTVDADGNRSAVTTDAT